MTSFWGKVSAIKYQGRGSVKSVRGRGIQSVIFGIVPVTRRGPSYWGNNSVALLQKNEFGKYYWDPYKHTRPLRNVPPSGFWKKSANPSHINVPPTHQVKKPNKAAPPAQKNKDPILGGHVYNGPYSSIINNV